MEPVTPVAAPYFLREDDLDAMTFRLCRRVSPRMVFEVLACKLPDWVEATELVTLLNRLTMELDRTRQQNTDLHQQVRTLLRRAPLKFGDAEFGS